MESYPMDIEEAELDWNPKQIKQVTFYRQNRRGKPFRISREKYLRDDLHCGSEGCTTCSLNSTSRYINLERNPTINSTRFPESHYLLPDARFLLRQLDVIEELDNVILLQIVMEEVFQINSMKYKRLRDGYKNRKWSYFLNEHHIDTYIERLANENQDERNRRAFTTAARYLAKHFKRIGIQLVLLTDDPEFSVKHKLTKNEINLCATGEEYVTGMTEKFRELEDRLCRTPFNEDESVKKFVGDFSYPPHLAMKDVHNGISSGKFLQGAYRCWSFYEGSVHMDDDKEILVQGLDNINRATDGDIVAVEVFDVESWSVPSGIVIVGDEEETPLTSDVIVESNETEEEILSTLQKGMAEVNPELKRATGRIVGIIRRKWIPCAGLLRKSQNESASFHMFLPDNRKVPRVKIETRNIRKYDGQKILVQIDTWPASSRYPIGHVLRVLGVAGTVETETSAILHEHGIPHGAFSKSVEACLPMLPYEIPADEYKNRVDFRPLLVVSVDPPGCTDIDDALHSEVLPDGNFEVGVHIADVSHYILPGTALDREAAKRGTSVYLADRRIDMIPPLLSSNLCSLHAKTDKLVFSVIWKLSSTGAILDTTFIKAIINSQAAMTYDEAQARLNSKSSDPITTSLRRLSALAQELKKQRFSRGALMLSSAEVREDGDSDLNSEEAHSLVEEFMLLANCSVAEFTLKSFREFSLLRRHPLPPPSNFDPLLLAARAHGFNLVVDKGSKCLNDSIEAQPEAVKGILRILTTRCMTQALYCCSGTTSPLDYRHFGLAVDLYTHFTSPIRRYADLMVHRLLAMAIGISEADPRILVSKEMHSICENINIRHRMAQYASRASINWHKSRVLLGKEEDVMGWIMCVRRNALQVFVPSFGMEGFVFFPKSASFTFDEKESKVVFGGKVTLQGLDQVKVRISLQENRDKVSLSLLHPKVPGLNDEAK